MAFSEEKILDVTHKYSSSDTLVISRRDTEGVDNKDVINFIEKMNFKR